METKRLASGISRDRRSICRLGFGAVIEKIDPLQTMGTLLCIALVSSCYPATPDDALVDPRQRDRHLLWLAIEITTAKHGIPRRMAREDRGFWASEWIATDRGRKRYGFTIHLLPDGLILKVHVRCEEADRKHPVVAALMVRGVDIPIEDDRLWVLDESLVEEAAGEESRLVDEIHATWQELHDANR